MDKIAVVLINTGTPDNAGVPAVKKYLREFLGDGRVITMPAILRKLLVNGIIVPFRSPKSSKLYHKVWTDQGSPLLVNAVSLQNKLQHKLGDKYEVLTAMRYGNPSISAALERIRESNYSDIIIAPLFPQYASSTTGTIMESIFSKIKTWNNIPGIRTIGRFYDNPDFIDAFVQNINAFKVTDYEHIIFSYHGLPLRHVNATHPGKSCVEAKCTLEENTENRFCYQAHAYATTRLIAQKLNLKEKDYTVCFQSRFSQSWLAPFADEVIKDKAASGTRKILVVSPSFVTDCLETIVEIGDEYNQLFMENGGEVFHWVRSLNDSDHWISCLAGMVKENKII